MSSVSAPKILLSLVRDLRHFEVDNTVKLFVLGSGCGSVGRVVAIPEVRSSNPVIAKTYIEHLLSTGLKRRK